MKFKVGDRITDKEFYCEILDIKDNKYLLKFNDESEGWFFAKDDSHYSTFYIDKDFQLDRKFYWNKEMKELCEEV
jgi:hypothetical protein